MTTPVGVPSLSGSGTFPRKWRRTCGRHGHKWSTPYFPVLVKGLAFRYCTRCAEVMWL